MKTITHPLVLLILGCILVAAAVNQDGSNAGKLVGQQGQVDQVGNPIDTQNYNGGSQNLAIGTEDKDVDMTLNTFVAMLSKDDTRQMLKRISQKMKQLFFETQDPERHYITKIMQYLNDLTYVDNQPLLEEIVSTWNTVMEEGENRDLIRQMQKLHDMIESDQHIQSTLNDLHAGIQDVFKDNTSMKLIDYSVQTALKVVQMKKNLTGIVNEVFDIVGNEDKMKFIMSMVDLVGPIKQTLKFMMAPTSQAVPLMGQNTSPAVNPLLNPQPQINSQQFSQQQMYPMPSFNSPSFNMFPQFGYPGMGRPY